MFALHVLRVPVSDLARAKPFWTALLGVPPAEEAVDRSAARYEAGGLKILLQALGPSGPRPLGGPLDFDLNHDDLQKLVARLPKGRRAVIRETPDGGKFLETRDTDGNLVRVMWRPPAR